MVDLWTFLFIEMLAQMTLFGVALSLFTLLMSYVGSKFYYRQRIANVIHYLANFLAIIATMILFTAAFSAFIEAMLGIFGLLMLLTLGALVVAIKIDHSR
ncbi:MAG: hypothetical protein K9K93_07010 [Acholeplasmataceae bacterium]|nr:hypothetical protein [Acholeplasmataceae bacterium]